MHRLVCIFGVLAIVSVASATPYTLWSNTFDTTDGVTVRTPVTGPYVYDGGCWGDVPDLATGYMVMDVQMCDLQADEAYDLTYGDITITLQIEGEWLIPDEITTFWLRVYSRKWDDGTSAWVFSGGRNFPFEVEHTSELLGFGPGWQTFTVNIDDWTEDNWIGPFVPSEVYKFRIDCVTWAADLTPYKFGISHFEFVAPECPRDLDGDDDVDLADLATLLAEYGCSPDVTVLYNSAGFEALSDGDIAGQDGWENVGNDSTGMVMDDPTGGSMGKVVKMDATDGTAGLVAIQRLIGTPVDSGIVVYEWDQYREDLGDNVWLCDDLYYDGWWAVQWDITDPHTTSAAGWPGPAAEIREDVWEHVRYEINMNESLARVQVAAGTWSDYASFSADNMKGIEFEINDTDIVGNGAMYLDNVTMSHVNICLIDYDGDGYTNLSDLAELLGAYGCGTP